MPETVGATIKRARVALRLTQAELGKRVGVTRVAVSEWERDLTVPRVNKARLLAQVLGISEMDLTPLAGLQRGVPSTNFGVVRLDWSDVPALVRGNMDAIAAQVVTNGDISGRPIYYELTIEDDSMAPEFRVGDEVRINTGLEPWDGCQVVAIVDAEATQGELRNYRVRPGGFDLWPTNPRHATHTIVDDASAHILGVVDRHVRVIQPPAGR